MIGKLPILLQNILYSKQTDLHHCYTGPRVCRSELRLLQRLSGTKVGVSSVPFCSCSLISSNERLSALRMICNAKSAHPHTIDTSVVPSCCRHSNVPCNWRLSKLSLYLLSAPATVLSAKSPDGHIAHVSCSRV